MKTKQTQTPAPSATKKLSKTEFEKIKKQMNVVQNLQNSVALEALKKEQIIRNATANFDKIYYQFLGQSKEEQTYLQKIITELNEIYGPSEYDFNTGEIKPIPTKIQENK